MKKDLEKISTNKKLVEKLFYDSHISYDTRKLLLDLLYPNDKLGLWISRILMLLGVVLTLTGIIYFFAFNWVQLTPFTKLSLIEFGMITCLTSAIISTKENITKISLLSASIFVGIFMAVFGQIYQTGANAYQLFLVWSGLVFIWTIISNYAFQWIFWLFITNLAIILWWIQEAVVSKEMESIIFTYLILFNSLFLVLRELLLHKKYCGFLKPKWIRQILFVPILIMMSFSIIVLILDASHATISCITSGIISLIGHILLYYVYRYKLYDIKLLSYTILSVCIILDVFIYELADFIIINNRAMLMFLMGISTITIFMFGVNYIKNIMERKEFKKCLKK